MIQLVRLAGLAVALSLAAPLAAPLAAQEPDPARGLTVTGVGEVRARPDLAIVHIGVVTQGATARQALDDNNRAMQAVLEALKEQGIAERDLQTSDFNVQPRYRHDRDAPDRPPEIDGYEVSNQLTVMVRAIANLGSVLDEAVSLGSNQIRGIAFTLAEPEPKRDEARRLAVEDARRKARLYAEAAGIELGPVRAITESFSVRPPEPVYRRMEMAQADSVPIAEGEQSVEVSVTINWSIE